MTHPAEGSETGAELMPALAGVRRFAVPDANAAKQAFFAEIAREVRTPAFDPVQRPAHYASGGIECADAIEAALHGETDATVGWCRGNAIKYLWRSGKKDDTAQDLRKAIWYIERAITRLETREAVDG